MPAHDDERQVAAINVLHIMSNANQRAAIIRELTEQAHHAGFSPRVQSARRFVDVQERWAGQQFRPEAHALHLPAS